jgi:hypothetical protein
VAALLGGSYETVSADVTVSVGEAVGSGEWVPSAENDKTVAAGSQYLYRSGSICMLEAYSPSAGETVGLPVGAGAGAWRSAVFVRFARCGD